MSFLSKLFGDESKRTVSSLSKKVESINSFEDKLISLSDAEMTDKTNELKDRIKNGSSLDDILPEAFAVVREASRRTLGQRHYDVQIIGGIILHQGKIAEMMTGEGKTLVATLPAYLNALTGNGVHIVTVNDYLSRRDGVWMGQIYALLGLSVGVINSNESFLYDKEHTDTKEGTSLDETRDKLGSFKVVHEFLRPVSRKEAYGADITYGTNNEFGFDFLRDNIAYQKEDMVQRGYNYAIIDEIDSILIDEARTPLIISAPAEESEDLYSKFAKIASLMREGEDFTIDEKLRAVSITDSGITKAEKALGVENIYTENGIKFVHHLETAIRAKALFNKDKEYVVRKASSGEMEVIIVDEFTGRLQPGRRWSEGLHQAMEAKEGVKVQRESRTFASITFQNYFKMYKKLSGMTGTAMTSSEEFFKVYGLESISIPTNKKIQRIDSGDLIFQTEAGKFKAIAKKVKEINETGQPVLIGTVSIEKNELLSAYLTKYGVEHQLLNAKNHENEGEIIAQAGKKGRVTIATNMAGRGVDIKLGGNPSSKEEYEEVKKLGGLFVLGTERHEARRIDDQLRGRSGRQGDAGETQFFVSLEDSLMRVFASDTIKKMMGRFGIPEDEPIENRLITRSLESAQTKIEGFHFDARKHVLEYDNVMNKQRTSIYEMRKKVLVGDDSEVMKLIEVATENEDGFRDIIDSKIKSIGETAFYESVRRLILQIVDMLWMQHLEEMDYMRSSVNLRAYGQRDPLVEYKKEGTNMFKNMLLSINMHIVELLPNIGTGAFTQDEQKAREMKNIRFVGGSSENKDSEGSNNQNHKQVSPAVHKEDGTKLGRNDPCHCGSGKKYKRCHSK